MSVRLAYNVTGHTAKEESKTIMKYLGYNTSQEDMQPCSVCTESKTRQKNLSTWVITRKMVTIQPPIPKDLNGRGDLGISTIKDPKGVNITVTKLQWRIIADQRAQMKFCDFFKRKSDIVEQTCDNFMRWKQKRFLVKTIRRDNAG